MKVVLACDYFLPRTGGVETVVYNLAKQHQKKGHEVNVFAIRSPYNLPEFEIIDGIPVWRYYFILPLDLRQTFAFPILSIYTFIKLFLFFKSKKIDVVNIHFLKNQSLYMVILKRIFKFKLVVSLHGNDVEKFPYSSKILYWNFLYTMKNTEFLTACSKSILEEAKGVFDFNCKKSMVIHNGVNIDEFDQEHPAMDQEYLFALGRFVEKKGFDILIKAFAKVKSNYKNSLELIILGFGPQKVKLKELIEKYRLGGVAQIIPYTDRRRVIELFGSCIFVVVPSRREPFGLVTLEAMASGKALVCAKVGGVPEIIKDRKNGILVSPNDPESLADGILFLLSNPQLRKKMEEYNREHVRNYSWEQISDVYQKIYKKVLNVRR